MKTEDTERNTAQKEALRLPKHLGTEQLAELALGRARKASQQPKELPTKGLYRMGK